MAQFSWIRNGVALRLTVPALVCMFLMGATVKGQEVYKHDFQRPDNIRENWSHSHRGSPEKGSRMFLGPFTDENVAFSLKKLPKHKYLKIEFDLLVMIGWGGSRTDGFAPDLWQMAVRNGPLLVNTSFSLWPKLPEHPQAYPDIHPAGLCKANTAAVEVNTLGFIYDKKWGVRDAVYRISLVFPHNKKSVQFNLAHVGRTGRRYRGTNQLGQWALDNIRVEALQKRAVKKLTPKQLEQVWQDLTTKDAVKGSRAIRSLLAAGDDAVEFLQKKIGKKATAAEIDKLIEQLDHRKFSVRAKAEQRLQHQAPRWIDRLEKAKRKAKSLEQHQRIVRILATARGTRGNGTFFRRWTRVSYVLQIAGVKN